MGGACSTYVRDEKGIYIRHRPRGKKRKYIYRMISSTETNLKKMELEYVQWWGLLNTLKATASINGR